MALGTHQPVRIGLAADDKADRGREYVSLDVIDKVLQRRPAA
jgi:hypothetical protein